MITERTLIKWRKEALHNNEFEPILDPNNVSELESLYRYAFELNQRILRLTQELLDAHLVRKVSK
jgi:hypothetical protein